MLCPKCGAKTPNGAQSCPACGSELPGDTSPTQVIDKYKGFRMRWYRFSVRFGFWASALICLGTGVCMLTGLIYDGDAQVAYELFGRLWYLDRSVGALLTVNAVLFAIAAIRMLKLKRGAPTLMTIAYALSIVLSLVYLSVFYAVLYKHIGFWEIFFSTVAYVLIPSVVMLCVNCIYYRKRAVLFIQ